MITIHKYLLKVADNQNVLMPKDAEILSAQVQKADVYIWARVDDVKEKVSRRIIIRGTGHTCYLEDGKFIDTFQLSDGMFVFHVFDGGEI